MSGDILELRSQLPVFHRVTVSSYNGRPETNYYCMLRDHCTDLRVYVAASITLNDEYSKLVYSLNLDVVDFCLGFFIVLIHF